MTGRRVLNRKQAIAYLGCTGYVFDQMRDAGLIRGHSYGTRTLWYHPDELDAWNRKEAR